MKRKKVMPRPKGSKNKTKVEKMPIQDAGGSLPEVYEDAEVIEKEADQVIEEVLKKPDSIVSATGCKGCGHDQAKHYKSGSGTTDWCNNPGCECLSFQ